jgi:hypothetical protein
VPWTPFCNECQEIADRGQSGRPDFEELLADAA